MSNDNYSEFLKAADAAARKVHSSKAKHQIINHVWSLEKDKYVKVKRYKIKTTMTRREERKFFGHSFGTNKKSNLYIDKDGVTLLFDKLKRFCDILPKTEDNIKFLSENRGVQYEMFI